MSQERDAFEMACVAVFECGSFGTSAYPLMGNSVCQVRLSTACHILRRCNSLHGNPCPLIPHGLFLPCPLQELYLKKLFKCLS